MAIDLARARAETPGASQVLHFNNAGAGLMPGPVREAVVAHLDLESRIGGYEAAAGAAEKVERVYDAAAALLNCDRGEIAIVENATRGWDMAFYALPFAAGECILTSEAEYASNYISYLQVARRTGARVEAVPSEATGEMSVAALERMIDKDVKLIAVTHVPTNGGLVNPVAAVGRIARAAGIPYLVDACQSVGQMPVDVAAVGCDMLSTTGRKYLRGPRGTGILYVRRGLAERLEPPFLDLHAATWVARDDYRVRDGARRFENWETNVAAKIGLGVAADYALSWGMEAIYARVRALADSLRAGLAAIPGVSVRDLGRERCGIVSFTAAQKSPRAIKEALGERRINVHVSRAGSTLLDMQARGIAELVRASVHYYNGEDEVGRFCEELARVLKG
ncbi:MAG: aminotransferase class V-fold PLP-dependent enzyme [Proteobacteria bacterium]|nr:aminotransferase class V-fold PLP-dependent enzyme [Pseudomonadota bacterium]